MFDKISIVIPTHNNLRSLKDCLHSVIANSIRPYEIIVLDNASADGTKEYLAGLPEVRYIRNRKNLFFTKAVNKGIAASGGKYIFCLNDDCVILRKDWQGFYLSCLKKNRKIGVAGPYWKNISELPFGWIEPYAALYPAEVFRKIGPLPYYDDSFLLWWSDIYHAYKLMSRDYLLLPLARPLVDSFIRHCRTGESGETVLKFKPRLAKECFSWHGKKVMYRRLGIKDEDRLCGYYQGKIFQKADFPDFFKK